MVQFVLLSIAAFLSGILTFLAPCTLPLMPAYFAYSARSERTTVLKNTLLFSLGLAVMFTLLGLGAGSIGNLLINYKRELLYFSGALVMIFGMMSLFGVSIRLLKADITHKNTLLGSFLFGLFFGITWTGCIGPVLGFILVLAANTGTAFLGGLLLFIYAAGLVFPLNLISLYLDRLPKKGKVWGFLHGRLFEIKLFGKTLYLHSTNLISGLLFITLGIILILNASYSITKFFPQLTELVFDIEDKIVQLFGVSI